MKKFIYLFVLSLVIISCSSDDGAKQKTQITQATQKKNLGLVEKWAWISTSGGNVGSSTTPLTTGKNYILILKENDSYSLLEDGIETAKGTYTLTTKESIYNHKMEDFISFQNSMFPVENGIITTNEDKTIMSIDDNFYDGFGSSFKRIE
jgi:hypothetical protein